MTSDLRAELDGALAALRGAFGDVQPRVGLILGSGLGSFAEKLDGARKLPFDRIPGFAASTIVGHALAWERELIVRRRKARPC